MIKYKFDTGSDDDETGVSLVRTEDGKFKVCGTMRIREPYDIIEIKSMFEKYLDEELHSAMDEYNKKRMNGEESPGEVVGLLPKIDLDHSILERERWVIAEICKAWGMPAKKMNCWLCEKPMDTKESIKLINGELRAMHAGCSAETYPEIREWKPFQSKMRERHD